MAIHRKNRSKLTYTRNKTITAYTSVYKKIYAQIRLIPQGKVATYGQIARLADIPRGARQVGYALRVLPDGSDLPWYRVIRSDGRISFDPGSAEFHIQQAILLTEGITFGRAERIDLSRFQWKKMIY
jgi:methylated-DNA-protein-cysteine methyltransferase-like protein